MTHIRTKWDKLTECHFTYPLLSETHRYQQMLQFEKRSRWMAERRHTTRSAYRMPKNTNWTESQSAKIFEERHTHTASQLVGAQWLRNIRKRCLMKRKEPRKSVVGVAYYHDDDYKGKQQKTFCESWKQEISPGFSVKPQKRNRKKR